MLFLTPYLTSIFLLLSSHVHLHLSSSLRVFLCKILRLIFHSSSIFAFCTAVLILSVITVHPTLLHAHLPGIDDVREHAFVSSKVVCILCFMKIYILLYRTLLSKIELGWPYISVAVDFSAGSV